MIGAQFSTNSCGGLISIQASGTVQHNSKVKKTLKIEETSTEGKGWDGVDQWHWSEVQNGCTSLKQIMNPTIKLRGMKISPDL